MNTQLKVTLAVGAFSVALASPAFAEFTDYWQIGANPAGLSTFVVPGGSNVDLNNGIGDTTVPFWNFAAVGPANRNAEFQRSPSAQGNAATGFSINADGGINAAFTIDQPDSLPIASNGQFSYPGYLFSYNINITQAGVSAYWIDDNGFNLIANTPGLHALDNILFEVGAGAGQYGFFLTNPSGVLHTLQIQGWEPVPEPSSIAMGVLTLAGIGGFIYRRRQASKA